MKSCHAQQGAAVSAGNSIIDRGRAVPFVLTRDAAQRNGAIGKDWVTIEITGLVPCSPNGLLGRHWREKHRERKRWSEALFYALAQKDRTLLEEHAKGRGRVRIHVHQARQRVLDPDNLVSSLKPVLDALKQLGWIFDDSAAFLELGELTQCGLRPRIQQCLQYSPAGTSTRIILELL